MNNHSGWKKKIGERNIHWIDTCDEERLKADIIREHKVDLFVEEIGKDCQNIYMYFDKTRFINLMKQK